MDFFVIFDLIAFLFIEGFSCVAFSFHLFAHSKKTWFNVFDGTFLLSLSDLEKEEVGMGRANRGWLSIFFFYDFFSFPPFGISKSASVIGYVWNGRSEEVESYTTFYIHGQYQSNTAAISRIRHPHSVLCLKTFDNSVSFQWRHDYVEDPESDETQTG